MVRHFSSFLFILLPVFGNALFSINIPMSDEIAALLGFHEDSLLSFTERATKYGYDAKELQLTTEDGYIMSVYEVLNSKCSEYLEPVLLLHGVLLSADMWLDAGENVALPYLLADDCYKVYVGNCRGNYLGRKHTTLDPDVDAAFWKFSVDEIGYYDVPGHIDLVLNKTGSANLTVIGFSQGGATALIALAERPEYNEKIKTLIAIAPSTKMTNTKSTLIQLAAQGELALSSLQQNVGIEEILAKGSILQNFVNIVCEFGVIGYEICNSAIFFLDSFRADSITAYTIQTLSSHYPGGASVQLLSWYGQAFGVDAFQKYDFGESTNLEKYGTTYAPAYNLSVITAPVEIIYGLNDNFVDPLDIAWLARQIPHANATQVSDPLWNHVDVPYSKDGPILLYSLIQQHLEGYIPNTDNQVTVSKK